MKKLDKLDLTEEKETLLITLYAKALDNRSKHPLLYDKVADELVSSIDYDFKKFESFENNNIIVVRAKQYDIWLQRFLKATPDAIVLNLGCGLDTRVTRIRPSAAINWFDVDYPEVIAFRKKFYSDSEGYTMIASSVTSQGWIEQLPNDRHAIIIAEGLLEYLEEAEVKALLNRLTAHFRHGQLIFDVMSSFAIKAGQSNLKKTTGAVHKWAIDKASQVDKLDPRLRLISDLSLFKSPYMQGLPLKFRLLYGLLSIIPRYKNMMRLMRYRF
jgi:O-methyltransferase involved in polyketide biosynthesis